jgi:hypothetical protein
MRREGRAPKRAESAEITVKWARSRNRSKSQSSCHGTIPKEEQTREARVMAAEITVKWVRSRNHNEKEKAVETQPERRKAMRGNQISKLYPNTAKLIVSVTFIPGIVDFSFW